MKRPESVDLLSLDTKIENVIKNLDTLNELVNYIGVNSKDLMEACKSNFIEPITANVGKITDNYIIPPTITDTKKITDNYTTPMKQFCPFKKHITFSYNTNYGDKRFLTNQTECFEYCDKEYCMGWKDGRCILIEKNNY